MEYQPGENAYAVRTCGAWILKPVCNPADIAPGGNGIAVRSAGGAWVLSPAAPVEGEENALTVRSAGGEAILWPIRCPHGGSGSGGGGGGCTGPHPLCSYCDCNDPVRETYTVSLSGIPDICTAGICNGVFTVSHVSDCVWEYHINAFTHIMLHLSGPWIVAWSIEQGPSGNFMTDYGEACRPEDSAWSPNYCFAPGCEGLESGFLANGVCVVS
ncbi:MAG: hypothetical protein V1918_05540 [Planctomycetota bacterium]